MTEAKPRTYNVNVGVLGHVDSGKTSLVAALSTVLSTAALDKHPQSKERGITLDLGFSSFSVPAPPAVAAAGYERLQFTLVDCPGHASLIRTIIGGAQIIDMMVLVVDITKGIQTQTAECIVLGEVATGDMVVALNKVDQLPGDKRERYVSRARKLVAQTLAATRFAGSPMVPTAAHPGAGADVGGDGAEAAAPLGVVEIVEALVAKARVRPGGGAGPFLFYIDHCFAIKGQGTVLTGTVVRGSLRVGDALELPDLKLTRKVKGMQMFRAPVAACGQGDRVGICVTQVEAKLIERGVACSPGSVPTFSAAVAAVERIRFFAGEVRSRSKWHVTVGHATVMAELLFFGEPDDQAGGEAALAAQVGACRLEERGSGGAGASGEAARFDVVRDYQYQECLYGAEGRPRADDHASGSGDGGAGDDGSGGGRHHGRQWAYLVFSQPVTAPVDALVIGSRLDADLNASSCRLAFHGHICRLIDPSDPAQLRQLRVCKSKSRQGSVERVEADGCTAVCRGMFKKDTDMALFTGMRVTAEAGGAEGRIEGAFGKSGKFRVHFSGGAPTEPGARLLLSFRRLLFDKEKKRMLQ